MRFPLVDGRLRGYERAIAKVAAKRGLNLQMRYDGKKGLVTFYMTAKIDASVLSLQSKLEKITQNFEALKEALQEINKFEKRWAKIVS